MEIPHVCVTQADGSWTDENGRPLTFDEAFLAGEYLNHKGQTFFEEVRDAAARAAMRFNRRVVLALLGQSMERDCLDLIDGRTG